MSSQSLFQKDLFRLFQIMFCFHDAAEVEYCFVVIFVAIKVY